MSSIATFYLLSIDKRDEFDDAHRNQKTVTYKRGLFGTKELVTGERFLWEYLDTASIAKTEFDYSGFVFIDYLLTYVSANLPKDLETALSSTAVDDHHYAISAELAVSLEEYLRSHPPDSAALETFITENNPDADEEYINILRDTHDFLRRWFGSIEPSHFGVIHITF
jgi:hypothetical protein